jgi:hypothetical protein
MPIHLEKFDAHRWWGREMRRPYAVVTRIVEITPPVRNPPTGYVAYGIDGDGGEVRFAVHVPEEMLGTFVQVMQEQRVAVITAPPFPQEPPRRGRPSRYRISGDETYVVVDGSGGSPSNTEVTDPPPKDKDGLLATLPSLFAAQWMAVTLDNARSFAESVELPDRTR